MQSTIKNSRRKGIRPPELVLAMEPANQYRVPAEWERHYSPSFERFGIALEKTNWTAIDLAEQTHSAHSALRASGSFWEFVHPSPAPLQANAGVVQEFRVLAEKWISETEHTSSIKKACMHPAYQRIIGMGRNAIPLLLRELQDNPDHWFWALHAITGEDPGQDEDTFDGAVRAWLRWGREKGFI